MEYTTEWKSVTAGQGEQHDSDLTQGSTDWGEMLGNRCTGGGGANQTQFQKMRHRRRKRCRQSGNLPGRQRREKHKWSMTGNVVKHNMVELHLKTGNGTFKIRT